MPLIDLVRHSNTPSDARLGHFLRSLLRHPICTLFLEMKNAIRRLEAGSMELIGDSL
jgi:hypothetical protein